ncbi:major head domain protein [Escherichia coli DEC9C]|nr:major head domain protein [Escherichia coli DEC9C]
MGLFTTRQLLGYTEQKVKFRALFLELFFRRTVNFHTEEVMLDKNYRKNAGGGLCFPGC